MKLLLGKEYAWKFVFHSNTELCFCFFWSFRWLWRYDTSTASKLSTQVKSALEGSTCYCLWRTKSKKVNLFGAFLMINDPWLSQLELCYIAEGERHIFVFSGPSRKNEVFPFQKRSSKGAAAEIQPDTSCKGFMYCWKNMQRSIQPSRHLPFWENKRKMLSS